MGFDLSIHHVIESDDLSSLDCRRVVSSLLMSGVSDTISALRKRRMLIEKQVTLLISFYHDDSRRDRNSVVFCLKATIMYDLSDHYLFN